ncbi:hypothetical protein PYCCODRAFT_1437715 [Trametes coccinea BRFM310]|uniref:Uncharacterized protein n=1 Tax=Trametes coccinea (strain BRFM310) TaxID=1353009 RepID=A0A1Y2IGF7_TRAC3|nr:hypothetical protein PYCCODRAFT_1437715 [Trametes coccinea BRFM310]
MGPVPQGSVDLSKNTIMNFPRALVGFVPLGKLSLVELSTRPVQHLVRRVPALAEQSFLACGLPEMQLNFPWPGYERANLAERISLKDVKCNGQVAVLVANALQKLFDKAARLPSSADNKYAVKPGSPYGFQSLLLVGLRHVHGDIFVAELEHQIRMG